MKDYAEALLAFDGKPLKIIWNGRSLYVESINSRQAIVTSLNDPDASPNGNVIIEFPDES